MTAASYSLSLTQDTEMAATMHTYIVNCRVLVSGILKNVQIRVLVESCIPWHCIL